MGELGGRTALITGAGRGIGRAIACTLAARGATVVVNDVDPEPAAGTVELITAGGGTAVTCVGSVTDADFPDRFVQTALDATGGLDIIVNNAGFYWNDPIEDMSDEQWDAVLDADLTAPFRIMRAAAPIIRRHPTAYHRKVVNISSNAGVVGLERQSNYAAAKAGLIGMTKCMAKEWGRYGVNVNAVAFGWIATRLTAAAENLAHIEVDGHRMPVGMRPEKRDLAARVIPLGRSGTAEEAAGAVYLLCTPDADYINGQCLVCDGGRH
ncbi:SDR family NAD(P)-dependent oxidoreductase [Tsukamurella ocularis]|uniref:SDR family NAD(P)-dependent oxidoreductase n=1 Tax=Tsukamurella ocularis TaxID=1970234 RepID=UPI0039F04695